MLSQLYVQKTSPVHALNFWTKFLGFSLVLPLTAFIARPAALPFLGGLLLVTIYISRIGFLQFWRLTKVYIVSLVLGIMFLSLVFSGGSLALKVFDGAVLASRFILLVAFGILFAAVTNPIEIPTGFLQTKIPHKYGVTLMVGYRLMPLLTQKIQTIVNAQRARGARIDLSLRNIPRLPMVAFALAIPILHSTLETSVRLSDALISRGYNPEGKITPIPMKLGINDFLLIASTVGILLLAIKG